MHLQISTSNFRPQALAEQSGATPREGCADSCSWAVYYAGLLMLSPVGKPGLRFGVGSLPTLLMIGLGIFFVARPVSASNEQANPIPPNTQSVEAGKAIYEVHCVPCHGESGKGDGPLGLNPSILTQPISPCMLFPAFIPMPNYLNGLPMASLVQQCQPGKPRFQIPTAGIW